MTKRLALLAPLDGVMVPIETVPDPVFAERMVGDGVALDPASSTLVAPCDGEVTLVHASQHACTLRHPSGVEVLMHIGLETVGLKGEGFNARVSLGDMVRAGDPLIDFDMASISRRVKSMITLVVITNSDTLADLTPAKGLVRAGRDEIATLRLKAAQDEEEDEAGHQAVSEVITIPNPTGLHARPAATLVNLAKKFDSQIKLRRGDDQANAKSVVAIMALEVLNGDQVQLIAEGSDAQEAVDELTKAILGGLGEDVGPMAETPHAPAPAPRRSARPLSDDPNLLIGVSASPGLGVGHVVQIRRHEIKVVEDARDKHVERRKLNDAIDRALVDLQALHSRMENEADSSQAAIFTAHAELLADPDLLDLASSTIEQGKSAAFAWQRAYTSFADQLAGLQNEVLAGRANDVRDVGMRVLAELTGQKREERQLTEGAILIAEDLTPSDTATLDRSVVSGFATTNGGASSHVAILARSLDIPAVAGIEGRALTIPDGTRVILDGAQGTLRIGVTEAQLAEVRARQVRIAERRRVEEERADEPAITTDGHSVDVVANIGGLDDSRQAAAKGAEGVGLLRSEFLFMGRSNAPTEEEQATIYRDIAAIMPGKPLVIRTLDIGGDKPLAYLPIAPEENPFLGLRGVRVGLDRPEILRTQSRAILRAVDAGAQIHVMFPMIATLPDYRRAKEIFEEEREAMGVSQVPLGVMVEVPSVAIMADQFAREVDFFSVGTNDLTQYTLAMDRGHPMLAPQVDALNPAILSLIGRATKAAHDHDRWIGICGGIASDPQAVPLLIGLGVDELSCSVPAIPAVKAQVRAYSFERCQELAASALRKDVAADVRALVPFDDD